MTDQSMNENMVGDPEPMRWLIGGDLQVDPFHATLEFWQGGTALVSVPLIPAVLRDVQAGLTGVQVAQRRAMGIPDPSHQPVQASAHQAVGSAVEVPAPRPKIMRGWRFAVVVAVGVMTVLVLVLAALPSGQQPG